MLISQSNTLHFRCTANK